MGFYYDGLFVITEQLPENTDKEDAKRILTEFAEIYDSGDDQQTWFDKIKQTGEKLGYISDMKAYKAEPEKYKGSVADVSGIIRLAVTGRSSSPDMYEVMRVLGKERVRARLTAYAESI